VDRALGRVRFDINVLSVYPLIFLKIVQTLRNFCMHVSCGHSSIFIRRQCNALCTTSFLDDVMFSHNGASGTESKTTLCLVEFASWRHQRRSCWSTIALLQCELLLVYVCSLFRPYWKAKRSEDNEKRRKAVETSNRCRGGSARRHIICENAQQPGAKKSRNERKGVKLSEKEWVRVRVRG